MGAQHLERHAGLSDDVRGGPPPRRSPVAATGFSPRLGFVLVAALGFGGVALAVYLQFVHDMRPCAWCTFQRLIFIVLGALALLAALVRGVRPLFALVGALVLLAAGGGFGTALYQHFVAAKAESCTWTWAERFLMNNGFDARWPWLFEPTANCAEANLPLLGVPFAFWSAALFAILGVLAALSLRAAFNAGDRAGRIA